MTEIINTNYLSIGFPKKNWKELIERDNFIDSINSKLNSENKIVYLNGDEGVGKTTLLGQFCNKNYKNALSLFFNPYHTIDLDINFLRSNLYDQIEFHLGKYSTDDERDSFITNEKYRLAWFNLKKKYRNSSEKIYLIIDGLESRGTDEKVVIEKLLKEIPYGEEYLRIVITGSSQFFKDNFKDLNEIKSEELSVVGFSNHQINQFLGTEVLKILGDRVDLIKATKGIPDRLEVLIRLVNEGIKIDEIPNNANFKNWIDLDASRIDLSNPVTSLILSLLALSGKRLTKLEISKISGKTIQQVNVELKKIHVLEEFDEIVQFISISYQKYYQTILMGNRRSVDDLLIRHYAASDTLIDKLELSKLYANQKKWNKIPDIINELFLEETIKATGSI